MESTAELAQGKPKNLEQLAIELAEMDPRPLDYFTPDNLKEVVDDFLNGNDSAIARATYSSLDNLNFAKRQQDYENILVEIISNPTTPPNHARTYRNYVAHQIKVNALMQAAVQYRLAADEDSHTEARYRFIRLNEELYGPIDDSTAISMAKEILNDSESITDPEVVKLRQEFYDLLPSEFKEGLPEAATIKRSSDETKEFVKRMSGLIYAPLLKHADELISTMAKEEGQSEDELKLDPQA